MPRRVHSKISELPPELRTAVEDLAKEGVTYEQIVGFLREKGVAIGRSSVGRWGKDFNARLGRLAAVREQAKAIVDKVGDRPATEVNEATERLATQMIFDRLLEMKDEVDEAKFKDLLFAVAALQDSAVRRENAKLKFRKAAEEAARRVSEGIAEVATARGIDEATIREIQAKAFGIVRKAAT